MDVPLLIGDHNDVFSFHGPLTSSPPLFSLGNFDPSNLNDDDVMFFKEFVTPLEKGLPSVHPHEEGLNIVKSKP
jgi:hypothetical protein